MSRTKRVLTVMCILAALVAAGGDTDAAKPLRYRDLDIVKARKTTKILLSNTGSLKVACPGDTKPISGGGWFHYRDEGPNQDVHDDAFLTGQQPLARGWRFVIYNKSAPGDLLFTGVVRCTEQRLGSRRASTSTILAANSTVEALTPDCLTGEQVYAASAWVARVRFSGPDVGIAGVARVSSSFPLGRSWYANAVNNTPDTLYLEVRARCTRKLAEFDIAEVEDDLDEGPGEILRGVPECPAGTKIVNGGAHFTENGVLDTTIAGRVNISSDSAFVTGTAGWFAYGAATEVAGEDIDMRIKAVCLPA